MDYKNVIKDFAERTKSNLSKIDDLRAKEVKEKGIHEKATIFETTQLINSLFGLIVFPQQSGLTISTDSINKAKFKGWLIPDVSDGYHQAENLEIYIKMLRNAVAHGNIEFEADELTHEDNVYYEIKRVKFWNKNEKGKITWETVMNLEEIKNITENLLEVIRNDRNPYMP